MNATVRLLGLDFADMDAAAAARWMAARPADAPFGYVVTPNADHFVRLAQDGSLAPLYAGALLRLLDSRVVGAAARLLRLLAGAEHRAFAAFAARTAAIAEAELAWMPTGMTTVTLSVNRSIEEAAQEGVAGFTATSARLTLDHELRRDLLVQAAVRLQHAEFPQAGTQQNSYAIGAGMTWFANRHVRLSATYDLTAQEGGHVATLPLSGGYTRNQAMLTLRLGL